MIKWRFNYCTVNINYALCNKLIRVCSSSFSIPLLELYCYLGIFPCHQVWSPTHSQNHYFSGEELSSESTAMIVLLSSGRLFNAFLKGRNPFQFFKGNLSESVWLLNEDAKRSELRKFCNIVEPSSLYLNRYILHFIFCRRNNRWLREWVRVSRLKLHLI